MDIKTVNDLIQWHKNQLQQGSCGDRSFDSRVHNTENKPHEDAIKILTVIQNNNKLESNPEESFSYKSTEILMTFLHQASQLSLDLATAFNRYKTSDIARLGNELQDCCRSTASKLKELVNSQL